MIRRKYKKVKKSLGMKNSLYNWIYWIVSPKLNKMKIEL